MKNIFKKLNWGLIAILFLATFVRFAGLTWCFPYTPHPDEWNMAAAITRLNWSDYLNPHFYAYGQFPLYLSYFSATLYNFIPWINIPSITAQEAIFFLRFWSALAGVGIVYLVYLISRRLFPPTPPTTPKSLITNYLLLIPSLLAALTPGLIQISHFGTTESFLAFFFLLIIYLCLKIIENPKLKYYVFLGITLGLSVGTKISALIFGFPVFLVFLTQFINTLKNKNKLKNLSKLFGGNLVFLTLTLTLALASSPYLVLAFKESRGTLLYETSVATGQSAVFYTRQFINTVPILFQAQKIFPYALGWPIFIFGSLGLLISLISLIFQIFRKRPLITNYLLLITSSFLAYFLSQVFLFTKWTRFQAPSFAFFPIFVGISLSHLRNLRFLRYLLVIPAIVPGVIFSSIYFFPDIRFAASNWIYKNVPSESAILFDTGNVVDIPILFPNSPKIPKNPNYSSVSFDFYHLDENPELFPKLLNEIENSDYIIVPSRRIFSNHLRLPEKFPLTAKYYQAIFSGKLGFTQVAKIEPFYSQIFKDERAEETFSVFDHPTIRIYQKNLILTKEQYEELFK